MATDEQYHELRRLIAGLTERVYKLEQLAHIDTTQPDRASAVIPPSGAHSGPKVAPVREPLVIPASAASSRLPEPDLESKIGGHWLNRAGIVTVLIGVSYFFKYAFENQWVGPAGRVLIGLIVGMGVVVCSEYVRRSGYDGFSYSLKAVGIGVLYLSLWASSQFYKLIPNGMAFAAMVGVSAATIALALWEDAEVTAAFGVLGAFITPAALSTGENNAVSLFAYLTLLDFVALILLSRRLWFRIAIGSFVGTVIFYSAWNARFYTGDQFTTALLWVAVFFLVFAAMPFALIRGEREGSSSSASTPIVAVALGNAAAYSFAVWGLVHNLWPDRQIAEAAAALGVLYFVMAYLLGKASFDDVVAETHAAIGVAFLIAAVPLAFDARWITVGWLVEGAALIVVSERTQSQAVRFLGALALLLGTCRVLAVDEIHVKQLLLNERMLVSIVAVAALLVAAASWEKAVSFLIVTMNVVALVALHREIVDASQGVGRNFADSALLMFYGAGLMAFGFFKDSQFLRWQALVLIGATIGKVFLYDTSFMDVGYRVLSFIALGLILLATSFLYQRNWFSKQQ